MTNHSKYFLDCEFIEDGKTIDLVSIGIVCEDGREFYAENSEADLSKASDWVKENVISKLCSQAPADKISETWIKVGGNSWGGLLNREELRSEIINFCNPEAFGKPEFWAYYADYDYAKNMKL
jgi:hypothetical protein